MERFESPLSSRYASPEMLSFFTPQYKYSTWRRLWVALAEAQKELGLGVSQSQIDQMTKNIHSIDFEKAAFYEKSCKHDVMAHIHAFGDACPEAKGIIHLGATSCYVTDNGDLLQMKEALALLHAKLVHVLRQFRTQAQKYADLPCLSYTHLQPAQPTTVGKRVCLWLQDFLMDLEDLTDRMERLCFLGVKGATGTQASFLALFDGDLSKPGLLEQKVAAKMGFSKVLTISGQTYTRKQDVRVFQALSSIAVSAHKFATDLRLLAHMKEMGEPFGDKQVGSSAMPYKRNPILSERVCGLSRFLISLQENPIYTASTQWLERSLDDSSNRRLSIPEAFLAADAVLNLVLVLSSELVVYPKIIEKRLTEELPSLAMENILMAAVKKGKDRQDLHEALRLHGREDDPLDRIARDERFGLSERELSEIVNPRLFIGRAPEQVTEFLEKEVAPVLEKYKDSPSFSPDIEV